MRRRLLVPRSVRVNRPSIPVDVPLFCWPFSVMEAPETGLPFSSVMRPVTVRASWANSGGNSHRKNKAHSSIVRASCVIADKFLVMEMEECGLVVISIFKFTFVWEHLTNGNWWSVYDN